MPFRRCFRPSRCSSSLGWTVQCLGDGRWPKKTGQGMDEIEISINGEKFEQDSDAQPLLPRAREEPQQEGATLVTPSLASVKPVALVRTELSWISTP